MDTVPPPGNHTKGKDLEEDRRDFGEMNWTTIWQKIAPDRQMWKQHAEAFAQPRDTTMAAQ